MKIHLELSPALIAAIGAETSEATFGKLLLAMSREKKPHAPRPLSEPQVYDEVGLHLGHDYSPPPEALIDGRIQRYGKGVQSPGVFIRSLIVEGSLSTSAMFEVYRRWAGAGVKAALSKEAFLSHVKNSRKHQIAKAQATGRVLTATRLLPKVEQTA